MMGYGVLFLMIAIGLVFVLKQTFNTLWLSIAIAAVCSVAIVMLCPFAASMSKSQFAQWVGNQSLMLDVAVVVCIESSLIMTFCLRAISRPASWLTRVLQWFPGVMIVPVLLFAETTLMFTLTGMSFTVIAWVLAFATLILLPMLSFVLRMLIPEHELRLELLFLLSTVSAIIAILLPSIPNS